MSSTPLLGRAGEIVSEDAYNHKICVKFDKLPHEMHNKCFDIPDYAVLPLEKFPIYQSAVAKLTLEEREVLGIVTHI